MVSCGTFHQGHWLTNGTILIIINAMKLEKGTCAMDHTTGNDFIVIKAEENGVQVIGLTRGQDTRFHHTEKLDKGEVMIAQFTTHTSAIKIRGKATLITKHGEIESE
jgi:transcription attenuation protein (tryptophan RNA-binding attenuator protein)